MRIRAFVLAATSSMCFSAQARLIDDFTQGSLNISAGPLQTVTDVENGLDPTKVIGGERRTTARDDVSIRINDPAPTPVPGAIFDQGILKFDGEGEFNYGYSTPLHVDLTAGGAREFRLRMSGDMRAEYMERAILVLETSDGMGGVDVASKGWGGTFKDNGAYRTGYIPFNTFEDVTDVLSITLRFEGVPAAIASRAFAVNHFETAIPEPATAMLALAPALGLAAYRRSTQFAPAHA